MYRTEVVKHNRERKQQEKREKKVADRVAILGASIASVSSAKPLAGSSAAASTTSAGGSSNGPAATAAITAAASTAAAMNTSTLERHHLHNYRVIQRNLVYVIGLPSNLANEELLRKPEYLGQYGKIGKVVIHRNQASSHTTVSAYVTFVYKDDAKVSIQSLEGFWLEGNLLRASFGTTKYCNKFIRGVPCNNPDCVYLHELGDDDDRFTKEEIQAGQSKLLPTPRADQQIVTGNGGPSGTGKRPAQEPVFPPPVFLQDIGGPKALKAAGWASVGGKSPTPGSPETLAASLQEELPAMKLPVAVSQAAIDNFSGSNNKSNSSNIKHDTATTSKIDNTHGDKTNGSSKGSKNGISSTTNASSPFAPREEDKNVLYDSRNGSQVTSQGNSQSLRSKHVPFEADGKKSNWDSAAVSMQVRHTLGAAPSKQEAQTAASFNGLGKCAVFPVPVSSLAISIWSGILSSSSSALDRNPFGQLDLPISELLDLTLPPVDASCLMPWPKPLAYYRQGAGADGATSAPVQRHRFSQGDLRFDGYGQVGGQARVQPHMLGAIGMQPTKVYDDNILMMQRHVKAQAQAQAHYYP